MLEVKVENIIPVTEARDKFNQLIDGVEGSDDLYVMTKNGKPSAILVGVHHLEKLTGDNHEDLAGKNEAETPAPSAPPATPSPGTDKPAEAPEPKTVDDKITFDNVTTDMISKEEEKTDAPVATPSPATAPADSAVSTPPPSPPPSPAPSGTNVFSMPDMNANSTPTPPSTDPLAPPTQNPTPGTPTPTPDVVDSSPPAGQI